METDWDVQAFLSSAVLGSPRQHLSTRQPCHSLRCAHSLCSHILLSQLFLRAKSSSGWHSDVLAAITSEGFHYPVAKKRWHPETESKKQGLSPSAEGSTGWKLPTAETQSSCLASSNLNLRHLPSSETILCWETGKKDNWLLKKKKRNHSCFCRSYVKLLHSLAANTNPEQQLSAV